MKKIKIVLYLFFLTVVLISCSEDVASFDVNNGPSMAAFDKPGADFKVYATESIDSVRVNVTTLSNTDRSFVIAIDPTSTALPAMYTIEDAPMVVKAGEFYGYFRIFGNYDAFTDTKKYKLRLNLSSLQGAKVTYDGNKNHDVILKRN